MLIKINRKLFAWIFRVFAGVICAQSHAYETDTKIAYDTNLIGLPQPLVLGQSVSPVTPMTQDAKAVVSSTPSDYSYISAQKIAYLVPPYVKYPSSAMNVSGKTVLRVFINTDGFVDKAIIMQSSGISDLDKSALQAVKKAKFKPYVENGKVKAVFTLIPIQFISEADATSTPIIHNK